MAPIRPITPEEVAGAKLKILPPKVIEVFNKQIASRWDGYSAKIMQKDVLVKLQEALDMSWENIMAERYLEIEDIYREAGWRVEYEKPDFNGAGEAYFTFRKAR
jgi:hypothetical protein